MANPYQMGVIAQQLCLWICDCGCWLAKGLWVVSQSHKSEAYCTTVYHNVPYHKCSTVWVVREPQKRAQDLGIKLQRVGAAASVLPSLLPSGTNHGENLFPPLTKCLANILPVLLTNAFLPFPSQLFLNWTCGSWEQFWPVTLFSPVRPLSRTSTNKWKFSHVQHTHTHTQ